MCRSLARTRCLQGRAKGWCAARICMHSSMSHRNARMYSRIPCQSQVQAAAHAGLHWPATPQAAAAWHAQQHGVAKSAAARGSAALAHLQTATQAPRAQSAGCEGPCRTKAQAHERSRAPGWLQQAVQTMQSQTATADCSDTQQHLTQGIDNNSCLHRKAPSPAWSGSGRPGASSQLCKQLGPNNNTPQRITQHCIPPEAEAVIQVAKGHGVVENNVELALHPRHPCNKDNRQ